MSHQLESTSHPDWKKPAEKFQPLELSRAQIPAVGQPGTPMNPSTPAPRAVIFDYGNTVIPFGLPEIRRIDDVLGAALVERWGPFDRKRLDAIRHRQRMAPYGGTPPRWIENDIREVCAELVRGLYAVEPTPEDVGMLVRTRRAAFIEGAQAPEGVGPLLLRLRRRFRVGLLSNYPDGAAIRDSLAANGLAACFDAVVVSADLGLVKPHPAPFARILEELEVAPDAALFVGDNWLADVQGAKRSGLRAAWMTRWESPETMPHAPGDQAPDLRIDSLEQLEQLLDLPPKG